jgi:hypothetical protein
VSVKQNACLPFWNAGSPGTRVAGRTSARRPHGSLACNVGRGGRRSRRTCSPSREEPSAGVSSEFRSRLWPWILLERVKGIEPSYSAWKAAALPLSYTRGAEPARAGRPSKSGQGKQVVAEPSPIAIRSGGVRGGFRPPVEGAGDMDPTV